jgi:LAO/AO transport system kinase
MSQPQSRRELARLITRIENGERGAQAALNELYKRTGRARVIGITGAPGSGKSSLVAELIKDLRSQPAPPQVAVVAVDPSSPFSGGAILGDRIRMRDLFGDPGVFIRSMASRGELGGIASATADVVSVLDAYGFDVIIIETVGAGQLEVDVARIAQTVIVVEAPGSGDEVQAVKAGILEIADVVVVNKADRDGVAQTIAALRSALDPSANGSGHHAAERPDVQQEADLAHPVHVWHIPIIKASALNHEGIDAVLIALEQHAEYLAESGEAERRRLQRIESDIQARLRELLLKRAMQRIPPDEYRRLLAASVLRNIHPAEAAESLLESLQS